MHIADSIRSKLEDTFHQKMHLLIAQIQNRIFQMPPVFYYRAVEGFSKAELSSTVASDLFGNLDQVFSLPENWSEKKFAVRSSADGEDSSDLSSAGQNETFLGCSGKNRSRKLYSSAGHRYLHFSLSNIGGIIDFILKDFFYGRVLLCVPGRLH